VRQRIAINDESGRVLWSRSMLEPIDLWRVIKFSRILPTSTLTASDQHVPMRPSLAFAPRTRQCGAPAWPLPS
jgi:hypothetical protein